MMAATLNSGHVRFSRLPSWIQTPCYLLSDSLKNTLTPLRAWLKLIQSDSNSFILTQLDDGCHLEFCHLEFCHLRFNHCEQKKLHSFIFTLLEDGSHLQFYHLGFSHFAQNKLHSFILTQLDDGSHLEFCHLVFRHCHVGFRHCYLGFIHLVIFSQIHSKTLSLHSESDSN